MSYNITTKTFRYGDQDITLETGKIARQASGAVHVTCGDTVLLATTVVGKQKDESFLPLMVNYRERYYSFGRLPGGFLKREGRPSDRETLISRLIDRSLRPLFAKGFNNEIQVVITVLSIDTKYETDVLAIIGAVASIMLTSAPFGVPLAAARVAYLDGQYVLNPSVETLKDSTLDLLMAGSEEAISMVESDADQLTEAVMLGALDYGHKEMRVAIDALVSFVEEAKQASTYVEAESWQAPEVDTDLVERVKATLVDKIVAAYSIKEKVARTRALSEIDQQLEETFDMTDEHAVAEFMQVKSIVENLKRDVVREALLSGKPRIDGRDNDTVRDINTEVGLLPRVHGDALFTRGETQAIATVTLAGDRDAQLIDGPFGKTNDIFMLHYNFPHYSVGECGFMGSPKRREIGHGQLAKRGLEAVMPSLEKFPYVVRLVSEITESNGSSSMATVCAGSLALMDAGIPITSAVAGVALGLIKGDGDQYVILTDILGDEDHLGDMDFKVAGTRKGITVLQMDIKIKGITHNIIKAALEKAEKARLHILDIMDQSIEMPRANISSCAPHFLQMTINPEKIRDVIGKGGVTIRQITEETGVTMDISDDGIIKIMGADSKAVDAAKAHIEQLVAEVEEGTIYEGPVVKVMNFGAFVSLLPGKDGFLHISQIVDEHVESIEDYLKEGQIVKVKVLEVDRRGRIRLSMKAVKNAD